MDGETKAPPFMSASGRSVVEVEHVVGNVCIDHPHGPYCVIDSAIDDGQPHHLDVPRQCPR